MRKDTVFKIILVLFVAIVAVFICAVYFTSKSLEQEIEIGQDCISTSDEYNTSNDLNNYKSIDTEDWEPESLEVVEYTMYDVPATSGFKSYMDYRAITSINSRQYRLQNEYAKTGDYGIRMINGRYCVAIGSYFTSDIGQYFDLVLDNEVVIPCILADQKADIHTDFMNIVTMHNGCASEFVVDSNSLNDYVKKYGNISKCKSDWDSPVKAVKIYNKNVFDE